MPPKITVTQEQVLDAAFGIVRKQGRESLTARAVAEVLGCSTQPIYRAFSSMTILRDAVFERAAKVAMEYLSGNGDEPSFLAVGFGNLRFARDEPHLYELVTRSDRIVQNIVDGGNPPSFVVQRMRAIPELEPMSDDQIRRIHNLLWFFSLGVASVFGPETKEDPMEVAREYLEQAGRAVIEHELSGGKP